MLSLFVLAVATAVLTYCFLYRHLERRDTAQAVRRLAARAAEKEKTGRRRPRLIGPPGMCAAC
jgi:hypothetical protein